MRVPGNERVVVEPHIERCIGNHQDAIGADGVAAKRGVPRPLGKCQAVARLEPLPVLVDQADQGDGHIKHAFYQPGETIETLLGGGVQEVQCPQCGKAFRFVGQGCGGLH